MQKTLDRGLFAFIDSLPEIAFEVPLHPPSGSLTMTSIPRCVGWDAYAHRLGLEREEFIKLAEAGHFGEPGEGHYGMRWWPVATARNSLI